MQSMVNLDGVKAISRGQRKWLFALGRASVCVLAVLTAVFTLHLLYSAYCALSWGRYHLWDYGVYTNAIWNVGHGHGFKVLVDGNYLNTHLSFALALLGPLFHLWDHVFLLALVQWLMFVVGGGLMAMAARRSGVRFGPLAVLLFFYAAFPLTQQVILSEFHGIALYYLLIPALYYGLSLRSKWAWAPWAMTLAVREDAFLLIIPMVLYFAVRHRWKAGYVMAGLSLAYGAVAILVLYPWVTGLSLFERRAGEIQTVGELLGHGDKGLQLRLRALLWVVLPLLPFWGKRMSALWVFPSLAVAQTMLSGFGRQYELVGHYAGPVMMMMGLAILETMCLRAKRRDVGKETYSLLAEGTRYGALIVVVLVAHMQLGYFMGGGRAEKSYIGTNPQFKALLVALKHIPKEGVLVTGHQWDGLVGNRENLLSWRRYNDELHKFDLVLTTIIQMHLPLNGGLVKMLESRDLGVGYFDGHNVLLGRSYDSADNDDLLLKHRNSYVKSAYTRSHGGENLYTAGPGMLRYWEGNGSRAPINVSHYWTGELDPGHYVVRIAYKAREPARKVRDSWGWFEIYAENGHELLAKHDIEEVGTSDRFVGADIPIRLDMAQKVQIVVTGADAELWLDSFVIEPADADSRS